LMAFRNKWAQHFWERVNWAYTAASSLTRMPENVAGSKTQGQRLRILAHAEQHDLGVFRKERPHAADAPTRLVRVHHRRDRQQFTQGFEFPLPVSSQPIQQRLDLRFAQFQVLKEVQQQAHFVERQTHAVDLEGHPETPVPCAGPGRSCPPCEADHTALPCRVAFASGFAPAPLGVFPPPARRTAVPPSRTRPFPAPVPRSVAGPPRAADSMNRSPTAGARRQADLAESPPADCPVPSHPCPT